MNEVPIRTPEGRAVEENLRRSLRIKRVISTLIEVDTLLSHMPHDEISAKFWAERADELNSKAAVINDVLWVMEELDGYRGVMLDGCDTRSHRETYMDFLKSKNFGDAFIESKLVEAGYDPG